MAEEPSSVVHCDQDDWEGLNHSRKDRVEIALEATEVILLAQSMAGQLPEGYDEDISKALRRTPEGGLIEKRHIAALECAHIIVSDGCPFFRFSEEEGTIVRREIEAGESPKLHPVN
jgi:hypothetical protein